MTTIAFKAGVIAADRGVSRGCMWVGRSTKIAISKDGLVIGGASGDLAWAQHFIRWIVDGAAEPFNAPYASEGTMGFVVTRGSKYKVENYFSDHPHSTIDIGSIGCYAIGSGSCEAMGAMLAGADALRAVEIAAELDDGTRGPFDFLAFNKD